MKINKINIIKFLKVFVKILGWGASAYLIGASWAIIDFQNNLFDWMPKGLTQALIIPILSYCVAIGCILFVSRFTKDKVTQIFSLIVSLLLLILAFGILPAEKITSGILGRRHQSPLWFRGILSLMLMLPSVIWCLGPLRFWKRDKLNKNN